ncbi:hypothetical protein AJ79_00878 [Helicocarpus griseus UAMH5409]|uniref:Transcription regulator Rua1 C-terminal domain-containing protein n=1 Tax=Helicocarpus griseus UAMH5409 TaxID=1447875 RepID=A0A2B7YAV9_9EURO|nr:hypothetical protein AJ79_00878 [Helicocarpus griseus UAMH5409]
MSSDELDYDQIARRNQCQPTWISPMNFPPSAPGGNIQVNRIGLDKVADGEIVLTGNMTGTATDSFAIRSWTTDSQPDLSMAGRPKPPHGSVYPLPFSANSSETLAWDTCGIQMPSQYFLPSELGSSSGLFGVNSVDSGFDEQNFVEALPTFPGLDFDMPLFPSQLSQTENVCIASDRKSNQLPENQPLTLDTNIVTRPLSESLFSLSSNAGSLDFNDLSAFSDVSSFPSAASSDYTPRSSLNLSSTPLSPVSSPRHTNSEIVRGGNRPRASPSPRASVRAPPYSFDGVRKRWSTGSYGSRPNRVTSPFLTQNHVSLSRFPSPSIRQNRTLPSTSTARQEVGSRNSSHFQQHLMSTNFEANARFRNPAPLASQSLFRTLHSVTDPHHQFFDNYSEFPSPPDLLGPLKEEPIPPPPEDMMPNDPNLVPHEQDLRFENDLYTPKWVRGHGNKREGWCGICKPGRWLVLKNSAFWYDKSFTHGISAATGQAFAPPKDTRRTEGNTNVWEGLCGNCGEWVALVSSKKKGTTWFRHAYKCHNNQKNETLKRRRENTPNNSHTAILDSRPKSSPRAPAMKGESITPAPPPPAPPFPGGDRAKEKNVSQLHTFSPSI